MSLSRGPLRRRLSADLRAGAVLWAAIAGLTSATLPARAQTPQASGPTDDSALFNQLPMVQAATLHPETIEKVPATVAVITDKDIQNYGYRTLAEALNSVCGFYFTYDRTYTYPGVRGLGLPGDYGARLLVMINGHYMQDNILNGNSYFGEDFGLDLQLVKRIEIVRGPSSALYGTNGILATINIVTISPLEHPKAEGTVEVGSFGERRVQASTSLALPKGASMLLSGSFFDDGGQSLYFPQFGTSANPNGLVNGLDGERGYHAFVNLHWSHWDLTALVSDRRKQMPVGWTTTPFDGSRERVWDSRNFVELAYSRDVGVNGNLSWRLYYDWVRYHDDELDNSSGVPVLSRDAETGDWMGSRVVYQFTPARVGTVTMGMEGAADINALQQEYALPDHTYLVNVNHPDATIGIFAQVERNLTAKWRAVAGVRLDQTTSGPHFVSPRLALLYQASAQTIYKILYGRAFRNPSDYERYYGDNIYQSANPSLRPEGAHTFELAAEHKLNAALSTSLAAYYYRLNDLIQSVLLPSGTFQFQNAEKDRALGVEGELAGRLGRRLQAAASIAWQQSRGLTGVLPNSPAQLAKFRLALPVAGNKLTLAASSGYMSGRETLAGAGIRPVFLMDLTASTYRLNPSFDIVAGMRNVLNRRYSDPTALVVDQVPGDGRAFFVRFIWRTRE